jgi:hypothetical protein
MVFNSKVSGSTLPQSYDNGDKKVTKQSYYVVNGRKYGLICQERDDCLAKRFSLSKNEANRPIVFLER